MTVGAAAVITAAVITAAVVVGKCGRPEGQPWSQRPSSTYPLPRDKPGRTLVRYTKDEARSISLCALLLSAHPTYLNMVRVHR
ncbi:hypothetical protein B0H67DRAFT_562075, partial [Lasiosphaeris hirsuta]